MTIPRLILQDPVAAALSEGSSCPVPADRLHHLRHVLRLHPGDCLDVLDGSGTTYSAELTTLTADGGTLRILHRRSTEPPSVHTTLVVGLPKGDKLDRIVRTATVVGVTRILPVTMARSIPRLTSSKAQTRLQRLQKIAQEAARLAGRATVPHIGTPDAPLSAALEHVVPPPHGLLLAAHEGTSSQRHPPISATLQSHQDAGQITLLVGPEGGLDDAEIVTIQSHGFQLVSLGPRILPVEVAAEAALIIIMNRLGDLGGCERMPPP